MMRRGAAQVIEFTTSSTGRIKRAIHERIVDELAEDGQRCAPGGGIGGAQGVANAEAHAVMVGEEDVHGV